MQIDLSHDRNRRNTAKTACYCLNNRLAPVERKRIHELLRLCSLVLKESRATKEHDFQKNTAQYKRLQRVEDELNELLQRYVGVRQLRVGSEGYVVNEWIPVRGKCSGYEFFTVHYIMGLFDTDSLSLLKTCNCGNYYVARSTASRFCSKECREKFWEDSEARKERKRQMARLYYRLHKSGKVK